MADTRMIPESFEQSNYFRLCSIYGEKAAGDVMEKLLNLIETHMAACPARQGKRWSEQDVILITYGDSITDPDEQPLQTLYRFMNTYLREQFSGVHVLPFFPYSSDDGFSVLDYRRVDPRLGDWDDISRIGENFDLMADLVLNHISRQSAWFRDFMDGRGRRKDYFIELDPDRDVSMVTRPRTHTLAVPVETREGVKHVWATFSEDQIDLNYGNPDVLLEMIDILLLYVRKGARFIRLDAIGFLWKRHGTSCIHLPETHEIIKLFRDVLEVVAPQVVLITETNVPEKENLSYFGAGDEAHMVYQFSLPPLLLHALQKGTSRYLREWAQKMADPPPGCTYLNFSTSHDGIGLRPAEGLLPAEEIADLVETIRAFGGHVSMKSDGTGNSSPYEINSSLFDALMGFQKDRDQWQIPRFFCSQIINLSLKGIPAIYIHSLTATPNDQKKVERTGAARAINRHQWDYRQLKDLISNPQTPNGVVFSEFRRLLRNRRFQMAFHPEADQEVLDLGDSLFGVRRTSLTGNQEIVAVSNLTDITRELPLKDIQKIKPYQSFYDLISRRDIDGSMTRLRLKPYQSVWLTVLI
ncbi:MAG: sugar phosphorylase [Spirochaetes bacterium]|jgi:sucrose phosphorylase|nr:sugar phosphorylase [Spirochaetota bacterium]